MAFTSEHHLPQYFEVLITDQDQQQTLVFPEPFVRLFFAAVTTPTYCIFRSYMPKTFQILLENKNQNLYLTDGWQKFITSNAIKTGDLLLFRYNGNLTFAVSPYDQARNPLTLDLIKARKAIPEKFREILQSGILTIPSSEESDEEEEKPDYFVIFNDENQCLPQNDPPLFTTKMTNQNTQYPYILELPKEFNEKCMPAESTNITFVVQGKFFNSWQIYYIKKPENGYFAHAWKNFVIDNEIKPGDKCQFALIAPNKINVNIMRSRSGIYKHI